MLTATTTATLFTPPKGTCPRCRRNAFLVANNNPLLTHTPNLCYDCIAASLTNEPLASSVPLPRIDFFCRTYNLPFNPNLWTTLSTHSPQAAPSALLRTYTEAILSDPTNQPNLSYSSSTSDLWNTANAEWEKTTHFTAILQRIEPIRDSYTERSRMKWGEQYTFQQLRELDGLYTRTIRSNRITNPLQKAAVQTLCKLQLEMNEAIQMKDTKAIKDFSSAWSTFAKQAKLDEMIEETKTDDITTVAELYDYAEAQGFEPHYYQGDCKDDIDFAIKDIQEADRRLILESTGLQATLEEMLDKARRNLEQAEADRVAADEPLDDNSNDISDLLNFKAEDVEIESESDDAALNLNFEPKQTPAPTTVKPLEPTTNELTDSKPQEVKPLEPQEVTNDESQESWG